MLITCSSAQDSSFLKVGEEGEAELRNIGGSEWQTQSWTQVVVKGGPVTSGHCQRYSHAAWNVLLGLVAEDTSTGSIWMRIPTLKLSVKDGSGFTACIVSHSSAVGLGASEP